MSRFDTSADRPVPPLGRVAFPSKVSRADLEVLAHPVNRRGLSGKDAGMCVMADKLPHMSTGGEEDSRWYAVQLRPDGGVTLQTKTASSSFPVVANVTKPLEFVAAVPDTFLSGRWTKAPTTSDYEYIGKYDCVYKVEFRGTLTTSVNSASGETVTLEILDDAYGVPMTGSVQTYPIAKFKDSPDGHVSFNIVGYGKFTTGGTIHLLVSSSIDMDVQVESLISVFTPLDELIYE